MMALEAVNRFETYFVNTMDDLCRYVAMVGHPNVKAMYDTFHANIEEADPVAAYTRNAKDVVYIHISENDRGVPGRGHVPWKATFARDQEIRLRRLAHDRDPLAASCRRWPPRPASGGISRKAPRRSTATATSSCAAICEMLSPA